ncbi:MAG TPA: GyrI-like domain-containing protein [Bradyrhizobium sp.]|nr:GyrI-like domain-containing protein [Bradyrhizobium sp.]
MADQRSNKDRIVELGGFEVVYVSGERGRPIPEQAPAAFDALEERLPTLKQKRFYGAVIDGAYRACVAVDGDTCTLDLPRWVIPSGRYAVDKIADWERHRDAIGPTVAALRSRSDFDATRPLIEFYRSQSELRLLAPVV